MPEIDVTDVLTDPMVAGEPFTILRRIETVNGSGESIVAIQTIENVIGSVTPTGDNSLVREAAFQTQSQSIRVITIFRLRGASRDRAGRYQPDIVVWRGEQFEVRTLNDYSKYGAGMVEAECVSIDYASQAPQ